ncbi:MAG: 3-dehydroquinate synthase, partial [Balneolaceae bacterium]
GHGLPDRLNEFHPGNLLFVIIDENVDQLHGERIRTWLERTGMQARFYKVPSGEPSKSEEEWSRIVSYLLENEVRRNTPLMAVGGGVTGDLAGFAAATTLRGIPLIHLPTTLLAMVDSSIGGKTGINHSMGKNLIGSFYQPNAVIMDTGFLETLPEKEWANGVSEILKYASIQMPSIFEECELFFLKRDKRADSPLLQSLIHKSVQIKASIVEEDEKESGVRAFLNFGHTFAHSLEKSAGYDKITHGEAVFIGMLAAARMSRYQGSDIDEIRFRPFEPLYSFDRKLFELPVERLLENMNSDKKKRSEQHRLVLLRSWGAPYIHETDDRALIRQAWHETLQYLKNQSE